MGKDFDVRFPRFQIREHDRITIDGAAFRFVCEDAEAWLLRPADGVGLCQAFKFEALNALSSAGKVHHEVDYFLPAALRTKPRGIGLSMADLTPAQRARVINRDAFAQGFNELYRAGQVLKTETSVATNMEANCAAATPYLAETVDLAAIDRDAQAKAGNGRKSMGRKIEPRLTPVHPSTLLKWVRAEGSEGKAGLVDRMARRGNRASRFGLEQQGFLVARVNTRWLDSNRPHQAMVIGDVQADFQAENTKRVAAGLERFGIPGRQAIRQCIRAIDPFLADIVRLGREEAVKRNRPVGRGLEVLRPFERVEMDEQKIDLITELNKAGLLPLFTEEELNFFGLTDKKGRWWICMAVDCRTRMIVGLILTKDPKSSAAARCLRMAMSDKSWLSETTGAALRWDQYAHIELVSTDNGSAFKSPAFTHPCTDLNVHVERTIAGAPSMRGHIERAFQTLGQGLLPRLAGRTFGSVVERGDHPSEARACLGPEDLCFALVRWMVDIYHNTPHSGLEGRTPLEQWEIDHCEGNYPLNGAPDTRSKRLAFGLHLTRKAGPKGIEILGVRYHSRALAEYVLRKGNCVVDVRWDEEDIGAIEVRMSDGWIPVGTVYPGFEGTNARQWIAARDALRKRDPKRTIWEQDIVRKAIESSRVCWLMFTLSWMFFSAKIAPDVSPSAGCAGTTACMPLGRCSRSPCSLICRFTKVVPKDLVIGADEARLRKLVGDYARKADLTAEWSDAFSSRLIHGSRRRFGRAVETIINAIEQALAEGDRRLTGTHFAEAWGMQEGCAWDENVFVRKDWASAPLDGAADEFDAARNARQRKQLGRS